MWDVYSGLDLYVKNLLTSLRAVSQLQNLAIRERHWAQLIRTTQVHKDTQQRSIYSRQESFFPSSYDSIHRFPLMTIILLKQMDFTVTDDTTLEDLLSLQLHLLEDEVCNIVDKAVKEMAIEKVLLQLFIDCVF